MLKKLWEFFLLASGVSSYEDEAERSRKLRHRQQSIGEQNTEASAAHDESHRPPTEQTSRSDEAKAASTSHHDG